MLKDFARHLHWDAARVLDGHTLAEFWSLWCDGGNKRQLHNSNALREQINRKRAAKGLPPMKAANER